MEQDFSHNLSSEKQGINLNSMFFNDTIKPCLCLDLIEHELPRDLSSLRSGIRSN